MLVATKTIQDIFEQVVTSLLHLCSLGAEIFANEFNIYSYNSATTLFPSLSISL